MCELGINSGVWQYQSQTAFYSFLSWCRVLLGRWEQGGWWWIEADGRKQSALCQYSDAIYWTERTRSAREARRVPNGRLQVCSQHAGLESLLFATSLDFGQASQVVLVVKNPPANAEDKRRRFNSWVGKIPWRKAWQPTPVFLPGQLKGPRRAWRATAHRIA